MVTDVDRNGIVVKRSDGTIERIECQTKVWSAGVSASPLGKIIADQCGAEVDRAGRVKVLPDLTVPATRTSSSSGIWPSWMGCRARRRGHPGRPVCRQADQGRTQGCRPGGSRAVPVFRQGLHGHGFAAPAVAKVGPLEFSGYIAWLAWLFLHLVYLVGFKARVVTAFSWLTTFTGSQRSQLTITEQQAYARTRIEQLEEALEEEEIEVEGQLS